MRDFLLFRRMLTPIIIQVLFWVLVIACLVAGIANFYHREVLHGLQIIFIGPILARILCEFLILFFRMNETLTVLKNTVQKKT